MSAALALALVCAGPLSAEVQLASVFTDNMVLQRGIALPVWGTAAPGEEIIVALNGRAETTTADADGAWRVDLPSVYAGGPYALVAEATNRVALTNVLVGDVWVGSGQSNMQWTVGNSDDAEAEIAAADYPQIRLMSVPRTVSGTPTDSVDVQWTECSPESVRGFSAVAYYFGRELHRELGVPIGLIHSSWGGTRIEAWMSAEAMSDPAYAHVLADYERREAKYAEDLAAYEQQQADWMAARALPVDEQPVPVPTAGWPPGEVDMWPQRPSGLYNAMIAPLMPFAIRGVIWYQGESNASSAFRYRSMFPTMIRDWRAKWGQGDFPFLFVQLANWLWPSLTPIDDAWAELREAQLMTLAEPATAMAVAIDIGNPTDIHPRNKQDVGRRLALGALAKAHGRDVAYSGPMYESMRGEDGALFLTFAHTDGGLVYEGRENRGFADSTGFAVAGEGGEYRWADAEVVGDELRVWSDNVDEPVSVRYGWSTNPPSTLTNGVGLPASPFRTDDTPGVTVLEIPPAPESGTAPAVTISAEFPYESKYVDVLGERMHYVEEGEGSPILFLHGNPTSSYLWRNVLPFLQPLGRVIAVDNIGFGKSAKPDGDYTFAMHSRYIDGFIEALGLNDITLVSHDWGSGLALHYASRHEDNVRAVAFMEALVPPVMPVTDPTAFPEDMQEFFRTMRDPVIGPQAVIEGNAFIEDMLPKSILRRMTHAEMEAYREPFRDPATRRPILVWPNEIPIAGEPADTTAAVEAYGAWLMTTDMPKLHVYVSPGMINPPQVVEALTGMLTNYETAYVGRGLHYIQEDHPEAIGRALADWYRRLGD
ncbi:haloalkane dehalogenase [Candidatus Poribacteria bacterium]|nr:haloalkane dehalogenase [Candidatus Poribacteria bacterium]MBT5712980.1 haloalkane dehalogenase [Candidatus Poribacteria bacterium]MBT7099486.1 haloalkane dehalogenase [Candidatus Poribacteria bacterium]